MKPTISSDKNQFNSTIQSNDNDFNNNTFQDDDIEMNVCDAETKNNIQLTDTNSVVHVNNMQMLDNPTVINDNISSRLRSSGESDGRSLKVRNNYITDIYQLMHCLPFSYQLMHCLPFSYQLMHCLLFSEQLSYSQAMNLQLATHQD